MNFDDYEKSGRNEYAALAAAVADILSAALSQRDDVRVQHIQRRAKAPASLRRKLEREGALTSPEMEAAAKDLAGVRVILYTNSDVSCFLASGIMNDNFHLDWDRTKIHYPSTNPTEATELFISNNYVVRLRDERTALPEYARFAGMWCEVQVQTTLNHAWSEMAHDTIYKKPELSGFGGDLMRGIEERMKAIMRKYLAPAGYEFQRVRIDAERLTSGKELFDRGALAAIDACADNNERQDVLERFATYVLPNYDDSRTVAAEILGTAANAVKRARETQVMPIATPFGSLPGHTSYQIASLAAGIIDHLQYADVTMTFDVVADLCESASDSDERALWLKSVEDLAKHEIKVWEQVGPRVQTLLVDRLRALSEVRLLVIQPVALAVLRQVVRADLSGSILADYKTVTLQHAAVLASDELRQTRAVAIDLLTTLFKAAGGDPARREVVHALSAACSMPGMGQPSVELVADILADARRIVDFFAGSIGDLSFELRQKIEHGLYWLYRQNLRATEKEGDEVAIVSQAREALLRAILNFRDEANNDCEYVIYKTLVGFESVFPPAWDDPELHHADVRFRTSAIEALVTDVTPETAECWLERIRRCAATESNDMATFPPFGQFLVALGRARPDTMAGFLEQTDERLAPFLTPMLSELVGTASWPRAEAAVAGWVRERRYLREIAWCLRSVGALGNSLLQDILEAAVEINDDDAVVNLVAAASARFDAAPEPLLKHVALSGIRHLGAKGNLRWVDALTVAPRPERSALMLGLEEGEAREFLGNLVRYPRIEYQVEDLIASLATRWAEAVIAFFGERLRHQRGESLERYEAVPYHLDKLGRTLALHLDAIVTAARRWFDEDGGLFEYRGARLLTGVFPGFSEQLETRLLERIANGDRDEIAFVLGILRAYDGEAVLHRLCMEVVAFLPDDDELLNVVRIVLDSMGVTTGEFGRVEGLQRKKIEIEPWLEDPRERVREFATRHLHGLDQQIAAERRRSEEGLALRKLEYGSAEGKAPAEE